MDIHKPKPWKGLREFLKEYAIIVIDVAAVIYVVAAGGLFDAAAMLLFGRR